MTFECTGAGCVAELEAGRRNHCGGRQEDSAAVLCGPLLLPLTELPTDTRFLGFVQSQPQAVGTLDCRVFGTAAAGDLVESVITLVPGARE